MNRTTSFPRQEVPIERDLLSCPPAAPLVDAASAAGPGVAAGAFARAARSVWMLPTLKLLGFCCVLTCIAWLGERSRDAVTYGPEIAPESLQVPAHEPARPGPATSPAVAAPPASPTPCVPANASTPVALSSSAVLPDGRLVLNEASADELDRLPGIGKKRAEDIVALRARLGRFKRLTDLLRIRGIGTRSLATLKEHLVLDRPPLPPSEAPAPRAIPVRSDQLGAAPAASAPERAQ